MTYNLYIYIFFLFLAQIKYANILYKIKYNMYFEINKTMTRKINLFLWKIIIFGWWTGHTVISRAEIFSQSAAAA